MSVFDLYAAYYDLLYRDKSYSAESDYVAALLAEEHPSASRSMLELGCGTGGHALELVRHGYAVHGVDLSPQMVERAERRRLSAGDARSKLKFELGDVRTFRVARRFDAVVSLFHVMSYQTANADLAASIATARAHLDVGGLFLFDFWYGPAVLSDRPKQVARQVGDELIAVDRRTTPTMHVNENCVNVHFEIDITARAGGDSRRVTEDHRMRYLFLPEMEYLLAEGGFAVAGAYAWMKRTAPDDRSWYACLLARAA